MNQNRDEQVSRNTKISRRDKYVKKIIASVNYRGSADHEDVPTILEDYEQENLSIIEQQKAEIDRLKNCIKELGGQY